MLRHSLLRYRALAYFALLLAVFIWGVNFNVVKFAMVSWRGRPFTFLAARFWLATVIYGVVLTVRHKSLPKAFSLSKSAAFQAAVVGLVLAAGYGLQTWYLAKGSAVSAAFLTSTTVLWAPLLAGLFGQKFYLSTLTGAFVALIGILIMEVSHMDWGASRMDLIAVLAAVAFAVEILLVSRFAPKDKSIQWTTISCLSVALIMTVLAFFRETWDWSPELTSQRLFAIVFTGVFATAIALGLQNWAQAQEINQKKIIDGPRAAIISTLEPVFTTLVFVFILRINLSAKLAGGCFLILAGTLISELAAAKRSQEEGRSIGVVEQ
jgi:drug/metabolite transporter (DMT)-like permease